MKRKCLTIGIIILFIGTCWIAQGTDTIKTKDIHGNENYRETLTITKPCSYNILRLEFGWIGGPIWGLIDGYKFHGTDKEILVFYAKNVHYLGIGHYFFEGLYPEHWINREVTAYGSYFGGIITKHIIFGRIYGLP